MSANSQLAPALAAPTQMDAARRLRWIAIAMYCAAMMCFAGLDTSAKWLGVRLLTVEVAWARYVLAAALVPAFTGA